MGIFNWLHQDKNGSSSLQRMRNDQALEATTSCIMMADANRIIIYANDAVKSLLKENEDEIRRVLPSFSADNLIGQSIDQFHKDPSHQRGILANLQHTMSSSIVVGKINFKLTLTPLFDSNNTNIGTVVEWVDQTELLVKSGTLDALDRAQAVTEYNLDGQLLHANDNFLSLMGYDLRDIKNKPQSIFLTDGDAKPEIYNPFWDTLRKGELITGDFKRIGSDGREIWIQASYNPIFDPNGKVTKIVEFAIDITAEKLSNADYSGQMSAISKAQAVIEFNVDGTIIKANDNFLDAMGYTLDEIEGQHHSIFVPTSFRMSQEYTAFWQDLKKGNYFTGEYKRIGKGGKEVWIQASYNPILDMNGNVFKVVKYATVVTEQKLQNAYYEGQINAIGKSQAVIEFDINGQIQWANDNFLNTMGYTLDEIKGKHHKIFVDVSERGSEAYAGFWPSLANGETASGEFRRITKSGEDIWLYASYHPIEDMDGEVFKVVKYATDITAQKRQSAYYEGQIAAINKSQAAIEYDTDGTVLNANDNFLQSMGYTLDEIKGKHHSMFVPQEERNGQDYRSFWEQLGHGVHASGEYKRVTKAGNTVWLQSTFNPILDQNDKPFRVVEFANDVTARTTAINDIKKVMTQLAQGDLTCRIENEFDGEFKVLGESINHFIDDMCTTISKINTAVETITNAATEIATGNADLSSRTEQQASSLEETASSMEELTGTVRLNAENAEQANSLASQAATVAVDGGNMIQKVVETMSSINESAQKISDIIGVIDGIAFQTNILALNAAVEAARAGDQGRGFAVVASEVRTLAQRSAEAAKDIKELISDSVTKIASGNTLVNQSGETMDEVVKSIKRVNDIMAEIAAASSQQASGIDEVGRAIVQMDEMTQQNAALVEEAAAAAESLQQQSEQLSERVAIFKLDENAATDASPRKAITASPKMRSLPQEKQTSRPKPPVKASAPDDDEWESF